MSECKFCLGLALGMLAGALIAVNSVKAREMLKDGQEKVKSKVTELASQKEKGGKNGQSQTQN